MSQRIYVKKILKRFKLFNCKLNLTFIVISIYLISKENYQTSINKIRLYQFIIDLLIYIIVETQLDIVCTIFVLSRFNINLNKTYFVVTKYVLCYLKDILNIDIIYDSNNTLINYINVY